jgi:hypothetical protein
VEIGVDELLKRAEPMVSAELHELHGLGEARHDAIDIALPGVDEFERGYLLGIETARAIVAQMPNAVEAGVSF